ncbi:aminotransferase class I/II-fold pyridoxal phosphate-dependent enzyme [Agromyces sp. CFH 90414]|uniref:Aminotransferase class I/II-fold pyridoxal phosphate-dependent enzyme n=1 Tax=Agromyces agglutinans TaxID=2662258 RepID=A0A6I2FDI7_9MICO|nr:DegT/DnrJ/EryC1/StrS family aminotransferase [Agromyces agglutinans]MRG60566.1 aminotransferase class I/II-fold pyridoxal phosphate-dependent enzyme [Agromyces agglutinans]
MIPITVVELGPEVERLVLETLRSGGIAQGPRVAEFERRFADLVGAKHAVAVNNGTTSLIASLAVLDLEPGDEVITSPFTFVATLNAILAAGATARFADISDDDFNITAASVRSTVGDRTRVLMPVHLYGQTADMDGITAIASEHGLAIVEDAAQAHGATYRGRGAGTFGLGSFSFYATKNLTTGEGGIVTTDDDVLADRLRVLRNQGMRARYQYEVAGNNWRMTDLQAAVGLPQLSGYDDVVVKRHANATRLAAGLAAVPGIIPPRQLEGRRHVWHQFTVRVTREAGIERDEFVAKLGERGIGCGVYYPKLVFDYEPYRNRHDVIIEEYPVAERIVTEVVSLPVHTHLTDSDLDQIVETVADVIGAA